MGFQVIPAIDLLGGKCVRLYQGDFTRETVYGNDPGEMARRWRDSGAGIIHVVDLDGARTGVQANLNAIRSIVRSVDVPIQVGGGIRSLRTIETLLEVGVARTVIGTAAVEDELFVANAVQAHREVIVIGVDARDGMVATNGWQHQRRVTAIDLIRTMRNLDVCRFVYTDITRDGALGGPNVDAVHEAITATAPATVIASGGVASIDDIKALAVTGAEGVILGKALYSGVLTLQDALEATR